MRSACHSVGLCNGPSVHGGVHAGDMYDTDMDDKMGLTRSPPNHRLPEAGMDIQATQAGVSSKQCHMPCLLVCCEYSCVHWVALMLGQYPYCT